MLEKFLAELDKLDFDTLDALASDAKKFPKLKEQTIPLGVDEVTVRLQSEDLLVSDALNAISALPDNTQERREMRVALIGEVSRLEADVIATGLAKIERLESLTKSIGPQSEPLAMVKVAMQKAYEAKLLMITDEVTKTLAALKSADSEMASVRDRTLTVTHAHKLQAILDGMGEFSKDHNHRVIEMSKLAESAKVAIEQANNFLQAMKKETPKMEQIAEQVAASRDKVASVRPAPSFPQDVTKKRESIFDKLLEIKCLKKFVEWRKGKESKPDLLSAMNGLQAILDDKKTKPTEKLDQFGRSVNQHSSSLGGPFLKAIGKIQQLLGHTAQAVPVRAAFEVEDKQSSQKPSQKPYR